MTTSCRARHHSDTRLEQNSQKKQKNFAKKSKISQNPLVLLLTKASCYSDGVKVSRGLRVVAGTEVMVRHNAVWFTTLSSWRQTSAVNTQHKTRWEILSQRDRGGVSTSVGVSERIGPTQVGKLRPHTHSPLSKPHTTRPCSQFRCDATVYSLPDVRCEVTFCFVLFSESV